MGDLSEKLNGRGIHMLDVAFPAFNQMPVPPATRTRVSATGARGAQRKAGLTVPTGTAAFWSGGPTTGRGQMPSSWASGTTITAGERAAFPIE